eukprot:CCRYP_018339-RA/>CCRYP_018339-RA protein AED:0.02 eAED:0.02 QI:38/1/0.66/1/0.5/0.33/3/1664/384
MSIDVNLCQCIVQYFLVGHFPVAQQSPTQAKPICLPSITCGQSPKLQIRSLWVAMLCTILCCRRRISPLRLPTLVMSRVASSQHRRPEDYCTQVESLLKQFYNQHSHIGESHGLSHVMAVHDHAMKAIESHRSDSYTMQTHLPIISDMTAAEIRVAALLHDVDDTKYFPRSGSNDAEDFPNARKISESAELPPSSISRILKMISWVGCKENGNNVPPEIEPKSNQQSLAPTAYYQQYYFLIPRWSDRLEAVGPIGVVRCYQYNRETGAPLWKDNDSYDSPRPKCEEEVWQFCTPDRFEAYLQGERDGNEKENRSSNSSMMSHYYDKLLHIARPPPEIVRNTYLEDKAKESSKELIEVCLRFGKTGVVDEDYILNLEKTLSLRKQ